ncbi:hypothetical protein [Arthrobacter sp. YN]|uniref:hypothetical protein n=1 Tax=Arthrobacter sp. YN TaxID=2020486 RepID=UPI000B5E0DAA|nr:hypothetical protein [Arthrobacter sp. YN]ASN20123.1 hypothetical protein CGK93_10925 [Arthrobacter sp. YN]
MACSSDVPEAVAEPLGIDRAICFDLDFIARLGKTSRARVLNSLALDRVEKLSSSSIGSAAGVFF